MDARVCVARYGRDRAHFYCPSQRKLFLLVFNDSATINVFDESDRSIEPLIKYRLRRKINIIFDDNVN